MNSKEVNDIITGRLDKLWVEVNAINARLDIIETTLEFEVRK